MEKVTDRLYNWASDIDARTMQQALTVSRVPVLSGHVALMPDAHRGIGATVGSVIPTENAIIPSAVGVDLGCGMAAVQTSIRIEDLPDDAPDRLLALFAKVISPGTRQGKGDSTKAAETWFAAHGVTPSMDRGMQAKAFAQFCTLGSGNHFVEVSTDEDGLVWLVLHSGSRGVGNRLAEGHITIARDIHREAGTHLEDPDLAWLATGTPTFDAYIRDMLWAQDYAAGNRAAMMNAILGAFRKIMPGHQIIKRYDCHHNFAALEVHGGRSLWITRKGAIRANRGDFGIIPGSMGTSTFIVEGAGNSDSYSSCSHGAGRRMSRKEAKEQFTEQDLTQQMGDRSWLRGSARALVDEIPSAYKDIEEVMHDQKDLVRVIHRLDQIINFKGV